MKIIMTRSSLLIFGLIGLLYSMPVLAEYYLVMPGQPPVVCLTCNNYSSAYHKKSSKHHHHVKYSKRNSASVSIYYVWQATPGCPCDNCYSSGQWTVVYKREQPDKYGYDFAIPQEYISRSENNYDPDMATGDDDQMSDPNMDIDH